MGDEHDEASAATSLDGGNAMTVQDHERKPASPAPRVIARLYIGADRPLRVQLLACLLRPLNPLGLVAVAAGAFASLLHRDGVKVTLDEVTRFSGEQIAELARFVEQVEPNALEQFVALNVNNPVALTTFGAAAIALLMRTLHRSSTGKAESSDNTR